MFLACGRNVRCHVTSGKKITSTHEKFASCRGPSNHVMPHSSSVPMANNRNRKETASGGSKFAERSSFYSASLLVIILEFYKFLFILFVQHHYDIITQQQQPLALRKKSFTAKFSAKFCCA